METIAKGVKMDVKSQDGQFGFLKDQAAGKWLKVRLVDGVVVGSFSIKDIPGIVAAREKHDAYEPQSHGGKHSSHYSAGSASIVYPHQSEKQAVKEWVKDVYSFGNLCMHDGQKLVWEYEGKRFFAAGWGMVEVAKFDCILDLADVLGKQGWKSRRWSRDVILPGGNTAFYPLNKYIVGGWTPPAEALAGKIPPNIVRFNWRDGEAPRMTHEFWEELWPLLPGTTKKPADICVCCMGGHGRTGTTLAALMMASDAPEIWSPKVAILTVRSKHCEQAVETNRQLVYLNALAKEWGLPEDAMEAQRVKYGHSAEALKAALKEQP